MPRWIEGAELGDQPRIAIIGAGFGGIAAAVRLQKAGLQNFTILERASGAGGVWWQNQYPGASVDTPSHMYSFSFHRHDWPRRFATQPELLDYIRNVLDEYRLEERTRYGAEVTSVAWDEDTDRYRVHVNGEVEEFEFVISAVGMLNVPNFPKWPGLDRFAGPIFHTSQWRAGLDVTGKRIAVIGTGSTAIQVVPELARTAGEVLVFQREPAWIDPKPVHEYSPAERRALSKVWRYWWERVRVYLGYELVNFAGRAIIAGTTANRRAQQRCLEHLQRELASRPDLQAAVTPGYPYMGKRTIHDSEFYRSLLRSNVTLHPIAVNDLTSNSVVDASGEHHEIDIVVLATGFQPANYLARLDVVGSSGARLHDFWDGDPAAFLGVMVPKFPNFFMLYGPNTNMYAIMFMLEQAADIAARSILRTVRSGRGRIEVTHAAYEKYNAWLQRRLSRTVFVGARNYFKSLSGRVVTQWPDGVIVYWLLARIWTRSALTLFWPTRRGDGSRERQATHSVELSREVD